MPGEAAALLHGAGAAAVVAGAQPDAFAAAIEDHWQAKVNHGGAVPHANDPAAVAALQQEALAGRLAGILDRATGVMP